MNKAEFLNLQINQAITFEAAKQVSPDLSDVLLKARITRTLNSLRSNRFYGGGVMLGIEDPIKRIGELVFMKEDKLLRLRSFSSKNMELLSDILANHDTKIGEALTLEQKNDRYFRGLVSDERRKALDEYVRDLDLSEPSGLAISPSDPYI